MKNLSKYLSTLAMTIIFLVSCNQETIDIKNENENQNSITQYTETVDQMDLALEEFFKLPDHSNIPSSFFEDRFGKDPNINFDLETEKALAILKTELNKYEDYGSLEEYLNNQYFLSSNGIINLLDLRNLGLKMINESYSKEKIRESFSNYILDLEKRTDLNIPDIMIAAMTTVTMEVAIKKGMYGEPIFNITNASLSPRDCNFSDIVFDAVIIASISGFIYGIASNFISLPYGPDIIPGGGINLTTIVLGFTAILNSPIGPIILGGAAVVSTLINCFDEIISLFVNVGEFVWNRVTDLATAIGNFFTGIFGGNNEVDPCANSTDPCCGVWCIPGYECINGDCILDPYYEECSNDSDCPEGTYCDGGMCQPF